VSHEGRRLATNWRVLAPILVPLALLAATASDSLWVAERFAGGQWLATAVTLSFWAWLFSRASPRLRWLMALGVLAATGGECFFSLALGMYRYRLGNIPAYVPPGHTLLYAAVFGFVRIRWVRKNERWISAVLFAIDASYTLYWWRTRNDVYGLWLFGVFVLVLMAVRGSRLFFLAMYALVADLELWGTHFGCWRWPEILLGRLSSVPSGNPPSGVAAYYVLFDLSCLGLYFFARWKSFERWVQRRVWKPAAR
jgi:hypothetical protein